MMKQFLLWLFPELNDELKALRSANTKLILEKSNDERFIRDGRTPT